MHDQLLERRLRAALHADADAVPFTITAAELERRAARRRRRGLGGRRTTLLLAAAVATSLIGVGGALSGIFHGPLPGPTATGPVAEASVSPTLVPSLGPTTLPNLDDLLAVDPGSIVVAQSHGAADGSDPISRDIRLPDPTVVLASLDAGTDYIVSLGCLGAAAQAQLDVHEPDARSTAVNGPTVACDGAMHDMTINTPVTRELGFRVYGQASWRVVVRGPAAASEPGPLGALPRAGNGIDELVRWDAVNVDAGAQPWRETGLVAQQAGAVTPRVGYTLEVTCSSGRPVRLILGDDTGGLISARTETVVPCDPTTPRQVYLGTAEPEGGIVSVAADPEQQVSLLVTAPTPPVALAAPPPGWQQSEGVGPTYAFSTIGYSTSGSAGIAKGRILVVLACTGTEPIVVTVGDGTDSGGPNVQHFTANCSPDGTTNSHVFSTGGRLSIVSYTALPGTWTALTVFEPA